MQLPDVGGDEGTSLPPASAGAPAAPAPAPAPIPASQQHPLVPRVRARSPMRSGPSRVRSDPASRSPPVPVRRSTRTPAPRHDWRAPLAPTSRIEELDDQESEESTSGSTEPSSSEDEIAPHWNDAQEIDRELTHSPRGSPEAWDDDPTEDALAVSSGEPRSFREATLRSDSEEWIEAALEELLAHARNGTWTLVELPPGRTAVGSRWVFRIKHLPDGEVERYKARLVAKGYSQRPGFDYFETFAGTPKYQAIRTILALAAVEDMHLRSIDISNAFLNGELDEEVYMAQPEGFERGGPNIVCRLHKALYGLKQASRTWKIKLATILTQLGFKEIYSDSSIYILQRDSERVLLPVFVDDGTFASNSAPLLDHLVQQLSQHFKLRDLGETSFLLGIQITRDRSRRRIELSQRQYVLEMLERFNMSQCNPVTTPMLPGLRLSAADAPQSEAEREKMRSVPYGNAVGALLYLATTTRPDISFAVSCLCRFIANPGPKHWKAVQHLFRYLQGTKDLKLVYQGDLHASQDIFSAYSDADHAGNPDNGRSTSGYVLTIAGGAVSWSSRLQSLTALSTTEAEYVAAVEAGKEVVWMRQLLQEFGYVLPGASVLHMDNQSAISVTKDPDHHGRMKHLDLRFYWLRDQVKGQQLVPHFIGTRDMPADIFTKALPREQMVRCRAMLGLE